MSTERERSDRDLHLRTPTSEQLLIDRLADLEAGRLLCTTLGRGQFAAAFAAARPGSQVVCHAFDVYQAAQIGRTVGDVVRVHCEADLPADEVDAFAVPVDRQGEAELTRDVLQAGHQALKIGGRMLSATNNSRDHWLAEEMGKLFDRVVRLPYERGVVYQGTKDRPLRKLKRFECEFAFRDEGRLIRAVSRPGVFSHRSLDAGARALINVMQVRPGDRVLDLGCGSGVVSFAAAFRADKVEVLAIDSHTRAVQCTERGAELNGLGNVRTQLTAEGDPEEPGSFRVAVANPPYFSNYRIAEIFVEAAHRALRSGGVLYVVTKTADWYLENLPRLFKPPKVHEHKQYLVVEARK